MAATVEYLTLRGLNSRSLFSHGSGGCKSQAKVPAGWVSSEASLRGLLPLHMGVPLWTHTPGVSIFKLPLTRTLVTLH